MNKEDILKILEGAKDKNGDVPMRLVRQAFEKLSEPCEDAVSRADAFNAINDYVNTVEVLDGYTDTQEVLRIVKRLPSAQPELPDWVQKVEKYRKSAPSYVQKPLAWALYQTWKEFDR